METPNCILNFFSFLEAVFNKIFKFSLKKIQLKKTQLIFFPKMKHFYYFWHKHYYSLCQKQKLLTKMNISQKSFVRQSFFIQMIWCKTVDQLFYSAFILSFLCPESYTHSPFSPDEVMRFLLPYERRTEEASNVTMGGWERHEAQVVPKMGCLILLSLPLLCTLHLPTAVPALAAGRAELQLHCMAQEQQPEVCWMGEEGRCHLLFCCQNFVFKMATWHTCWWQKRRWHLSLQ